MKKILILLAVLTIASCTTKKIPVTAEEATMKDVLTMNTPFIKKKSKLFTGDFHLRNLSAKNSMIIFLHDITCNWGDQVGVVRNDRPFNIGEKTINIPIGSVKTVKLRCDVSNTGSGEMSFTIKRIFDNANHDGQTAGSILGENLTWKYKE
ncbi:MAG: hypothetical protein H0V66_09005 [Bdellovibrionales bacterium]|nr:hypothetical protein [Bdellovibrionales bacterium]